MTTPAVVKAKRFLVNRIVDQAKRANLPLTEVEALMLGFSSAFASPAETEAATVFDRDYQRQEYEAKISRLFREVYEMDKSHGKAEIWEQSMDALADEDMYLAVIIRKAGLRHAPVPWYLPDLRSLGKFIPAIVMVAAGVVVEFTPLGEGLVPDPILRLLVAVCCWLSPWLISRLGDQQVDEDVDNATPKT